MSWTGDFYEFPVDTTRESMLQRILEKTYRERMEPMCMPILLKKNVPVLTSRQEAEKYMEENNLDNSRDYSYGVRFLHHDKDANSAKREDLIRRIMETSKKKTEFDKSHSVRTFKAEYIGCPSCGSKLKRTLLNSDLCPLCRTDMRSKTVHDSLIKYDEKIESLRKQVEEEENRINEKRKKEGKEYWLIAANVYIG